MQGPRQARFGLLLTASVIVLLACSRAAPGEAPDAAAPRYGDAFWKHWGDGRAEIASYDLVFPRYGELRSGTAVAIVVTEPFSESARVKSDSADGPGVFQVLKLNLVKDFATGIYDYNTMLSAFVALEPKAGLAPGEPVKVAYSSQEWCGQVYAQALFDPTSVRTVSHSYFEGEADREGTLSRPAGGLAEDGLYLWARGLAAPRVEPGASRRVPLLFSLQRARMAHRSLEWNEALLSREAQVRATTVPAGTFEVETLRAAIEGGPTWTFQVERGEPRRLVRWETSDGERGELVATQRLPYWQLHDNKDLSMLEQIGLHARPPRTP